MKKPKSPEFANWMHGSTIRNIMFHATVHDFDEFDTGKSDLGAHFGNLDQVNNIAKNRLSGHPAGGPLIIPVWLKITNPIRLKDVGSFHADGIAIQLEKKGLLPKGEGKRITKEIEANWRLRKQYDPMLINIIKEAGYDGVVYANTAEGEGKGDSYIAFDSEQIVFAISNRFHFDSKPTPKSRPRL